MGVADPLYTPPRVLSCRIWSFWSNGTNVIKEIRLKNWTPRVPPFKSLNVIGTDTDRSATYDFLY